MSTAKYSQAPSTANHKGSAQPRHAGTREREEDRSSVTSTARQVPTRRPSYAEIARKGSGNQTQYSPVRRDSAPNQAPSTQNSILSAIRVQIPEVVREPEPMQHAHPFPSRGPSQRSAKPNRGRDDERHTQFFNEPFNLETPAITFPQGQSFAKDFTAKVKSLSNFGFRLHEVSDKHGEADIRSVEGFRSTLFQAVIHLSATFSDESGRVDPLCDYSDKRKVPATESGVRNFTLKARLASNTLPLQRGHIGPFTIDHYSSDTKYTDVKKLLHELNEVLGTEYGLERPGLEACLQGYIDESCDFGHIYGFLRPWWGRGNFDLISALLRERKIEDTLLRKSAVDGECIANPHVPPRRVWDLFSNRVLPFYALPTTAPSVIPPNVWAVSHSWKDPNERRGVDTKINNRAWCVPLPRNVNLHDIRNELLNLGAEYVFLDILCLRQEDSEQPGKEFRRKQEWRLDVPTIGYIYQHPRITIIYFNGLGEELRIQRSEELDSNYHWFRRVWTLQEATQCWLPGGLTQSSFHVVGDKSAPSDIRVKFSRLLQDTLRATTNTTDVSMFTILEAMRTRKFTNPVDAVAGLAYLLKCKTLPIYNADSKDPEGAWEALIQSMYPLQRLLLLVCWGRAGGATSGQDRPSALYKWRPTWAELRDYHGSLGDLNFLPTDPLFLKNMNEDEFVRFLPDAGHQEDSDAYFHYAYVVDSCHIKFSLKATATSTRPPSYIALPNRIVSSASRTSSNYSHGGTPLSDYGDDSFASTSTARNASVPPTEGMQPYNVNVEFVPPQGGRKRTFRVKKFIGPIQTGMNPHTLFPDDNTRDQRTDNHWGPSREDFKRDCVLVGVSGCNYWIVGVKMGSRRVDGVKKVTQLYKVAVVTLEKDYNGRTLDQDNSGHVDMITYC